MLATLIIKLNGYEMLVCAETDRLTLQLKDKIEVELADSYTPFFEWINGERSYSVRQMEF